MSTLGTVDAPHVENLLLEFVGRLSASGALMGNYDATERLLQQFLPPERVAGIMDEIRGPAGRNMWEKLSNVQEEVLANYLKNEYPQTIAVVLSKIRPEHAARVLAILPEELALDVVNRMLRMEAVQKEVIERVEQTLRTEFMSNLSQTRRRDAHEVMAEIFNNFDRQTETRFLTALEEDNRESAERIKTLMFTFDDLVKLDAGSAQTLMRHIDKDKLAIALKGASEAVREFFFSNMSTRAAKMLVDDMQAHGSGAPARRRRGTGAAGQPRQGSRRQGRDHDRQAARRRRAGLLRHAMSAPAKYLFDIDFGARQRRPTTISLAEHAGAARRKPRRAAIATASPPAEQEGASAERAPARVALEQIADAARYPARRAWRRSKRGSRPRPSRSRVAVASKLAPALIAREPLAEIAALATDCFRQLLATPHVVVRVNDALYDAAREQLDEIARRRGFEGRLVCSAEPDIARGRLPDRMGRRRRQARPRRRRHADRRNGRALSRARGATPADASLKGAER